MMKRVHDACGSFPAILTADTGYWSESNLSSCERTGVDAYIAVRRKGEDGATLGRLPMSHAQEARLRMHQKVTSREGDPAPIRGQSRTDQTGHGLHALLAPRTPQSRR
jgi:hypothetical protein